MFVPSVVVMAQEEETAEDGMEEKKSLEWSGNLDAKFTFFHMRESAPQYYLLFPFNKPSSPFLTQYRLEPYLNAEYSTSDLGFVLKTHATYFGDSDASVNILEAYSEANLSFHTTLQAGKRVYNWGKGYAFNPVGFVNPVKDPENPELAQSGLLSANIEYIKSFSTGPLQNISFLFVVIPASGSTGNRFTELKHTDLSFRTSLLLWNTDIDVLAFYSIQTPKRIGMDFSSNITDNLEIHGELGYSRNVETFSIVNNLVASNNSHGISTLAGFRYLHESNITLIAEYYHTDFGMSTAELEMYQRFLATTTQSKNPLMIQQVTKINQMYFHGTNLSNDYAYIKLTYPEPFEWLYFTPSVFSIVHLADKSFLLSVTLNYKPVTNIEFILWPSLISGGNETEYGSKAFQQKVELWMRVFF
ncbi:MAG: hypothetical protein M0R68_05020 [Bacteroidetes bacterium]|nr:hypothetical protein [Bacteroidota bacterium]